MLFKVTLPEVSAAHKEFIYPGILGHRIDNLKNDTENVSKTNFLKMEREIRNPSKKTPGNYDSTLRGTAHMESSEYGTSHGY